MVTLTYQRATIMKNYSIKATETKKKILNKVENGDDVHKVLLKNEIYATVKINLKNIFTTRLYL